MDWEKMTAPEFKKAVEESKGVCILPIGVVEKHGDHLPLGMDALNAHYVASKTAETEPAVVFPLFYFGMNTHAKCEPGAIALKFELLHPVLESVCDEIGRNGFDKIILYNAHGGNAYMLQYFTHKMLDAEKPYMIYLYATWNARTKRHPSAFEAKVDGHGGEFETSIMMAEYPELVKGQPAEYGLPQNREKAFRDLGSETPSWWYADHPGMLRADRTECTPEKGKLYLEEQVESLAKLIRLVKTDGTPLKLYREFMEKSRHPNA